MSIYFKQLELGPMQNYVYLFGDPATKEAAVVDPAWNVPAIWSQLEKDGYHLTHVFFTHGHYDHVNGAEEIAAKLDPVWCAQDVELDDFIPSGAGGLVLPAQIFKKRSSGPVVRVGTIEVTLIPMPGHTPGSQCIVVRTEEHPADIMFTGDFLFVGTIGRCDLPMSSPKQMFRSFQKLKQLPDEMVFYPGHDYGATSNNTLGKEKKTNPYLLCETQDQFLQMVRH